LPLISSPGPRHSLPYVWKASISDRATTAIDATTKTLGSAFDHILFGELTLFLFI
jgi:hypothetical protein